MTGILKMNAKKAVLLVVVIRLVAMLICDGVVDTGLPNCTTVTDQYGHIFSVCQNR